MSNTGSLIVREWMNALWFAISFAMCFEFGVLLVQRIKDHGHLWRDDLGTRVTLALLVYFLGESLKRGWVWLLFAIDNNGGGNDTMALFSRADYVVAYISAGLSIWGALCCLYVFGNSHYTWVRAACVILLVVAVGTTIL